MPGSAISEAEVTNISRHGFWVCLGDQELFLPFDEFPWFKGAPVEAILNVARPQEHHLYWPDVDVDLTLESIEHLAVAVARHEQQRREPDRRPGASQPSEHSRFRTRAPAGSPPGPRRR